MTSRTPVLAGRVTSQFANLGFGSSLVRMPLTKHYGTRSLMLTRQMAGSHFGLRHDSASLSPGSANQAAKISHKRSHAFNCGVTSSIFVGGAAAMSVHAASAESGESENGGASIAASGPPAGKHPHMASKRPPCRNLRVKIAGSRRIIAALPGSSRSTAPMILPSVPLT